MRKYGWFIGLIILVALAVPACSGRTEASPTPTTSPSPVAAQSRIVKTGEEFVITLDSNVTTGYSWVESHDEKLLTLVSREYKQPVQPLPGAGGQDVFIFKAVSAGQTAIIFDYERPWEKQSVDQKTYTIEIH